MTYFDIFYAEYPLKKARGQALKTWDKLTKQKKLPDIEVLLNAIKDQKAERVLKQSKNQFVPGIPYPSTWLNAESWSDEVEKPKKSSNYKNLYPDVKPREQIKNPITQNEMKKIRENKKKIAVILPGIGKVI